MFFGSCVGYPEKLRTLSAPGVAASMGESYVYWQPPSNGFDIFPIYGGLMKRAREIPTLEALVLLHDDLELRDPFFARKVRQAMSDPSVAIVGCIGARNVKSLYWWEGSPRFGYANDGLHGSYDWGLEGEPTDVDTVDGMLLILSPWAVQNLTLEGLGYCGLHGYPEELCFQARAKGKRVVVTRLDLMHHTKGGFAGDMSAWNRSNVNFCRRWPTEAAHA